MRKKAIIVSIKSKTLTKKEKLLLSKEKPWGLILFKRNIKSIDQIKNLIKDREIVGFDVVELSPIKGFLAYDFTAATLVYKIMELINLNSKK